MELAVEIQSGGAGSDSKFSQMMKPVKDAKAGKAVGKDGKTAAGGGAGGAAGGAGDDDKGRPVVPEVLPVESPPEVSLTTSSMFPLEKHTQAQCGRPCALTGGGERKQQTILFSSLILNSLDVLHGDEMNHDEPTNWT